jgi:hydrogenase/urease accessory protein HupE
MRRLTCPHCGKIPALGLIRFLPGLKLVRDKLVCSLCSGVSEFSGKSQAWAVAAMLASIIFVALVLRGVMAALGTDHIPMNTFGAIATFVVLVGIAQVASALALRQKAVLIPAGGGS